MLFTLDLWPCFSSTCPFDCRFTYITKVLLIFYKCILLVFEEFENIIPVKLKTVTNCEDLVIFVFLNIA